MEHRWLRIVIQSCMYCCLVLLIGAILGITSWYIHGGRLLTVQTGSMTPTFWPGDGLLVERVRPEALRRGDIISYRLAKNSKVIVSHRLIGITKSGMVLTTQGDSLSSADPKVSSQQLVGRAVAVMPHAGSLISKLRSPFGLVIGVYLPACLVVAFEFRRWYSQASVVHYRLRLNK